jgi:hypothetical protein
MDLFDCIGHQLKNKIFHSQSLKKKNPFSVSTQLTVRKYISVYSVSVYSVSVYSVSVYSVSVYSVSVYSVSVYSVLNVKFV